MKSRLFLANISAPAVPFEPKNKCFEFEYYSTSSITRLSFMLIYFLFFMQPFIMIADEVLELFETEYK